MGSLYRRQLEQWLSGIEVDVKSVLDVGGGQLPIQKRVKSFKAENVKVLDHDSQYNPDYFKDLNERFRFAHTNLGIPDEMIDDVGQDKNGDIYDDEFWKPGAYDVLFCLEVMEYIYDPLTAHRNLFDLLSDETGIAYISYPTWYPLHNPPGIDYLRYTKFGIEKLLMTAGFATWEITPRVASDGIGALSEFYSRERMRPMKNRPEVFDIGYMVKAYKTQESVKNSVGEHSH